MAHANQYPYQDVFEQYLENEGLAQLTINEYQTVLTDLFSYMSTFNTGYQRDHRVAALFDRDIEQYLAMLINERHVTNGTYNKMLSHINIYFKYLFTHNLISQFPTLTLKGKSKEQLRAPSTKWLYALPEIMANDQLSYYTRLTMLLTNRGYTVKEMLTPGFYTQVAPTSFNDWETLFWAEFTKFITPIQARQHSQDLFLKQRFDGDPHLTVPGLHKYLKPDEKLLGIPLTPTKLYQSMVVNYFLTHDKLSDQELAANLRLDPQSIAYYHQLATAVKS